MIEVLSLKEILMLFGFGVLENGILLAFCKEVGRISGVKYRHIFVLAIPILLCSIFTIPFFKQIILFSIFIIYLKHVSKENIFKIIKWFFISLMFLLSFETLTCIIYEAVGIQFNEMDLTLRLIYLIPTRLIQILTLYIIRRNSTWAHGGGMTLKKKQMK